MTDEDVPLAKWEETLRAHVDILAAAETQEEWNDVVAEILQFWICIRRPGLLFNGERAKLTEMVRAGLSKRRRGRPRKQLTARSDANLLLKNMSDRPFKTVNGVPVGRTPIVDASEAARCIASVEGVSIETARKRAQRAAAELGALLPPGRVFGKHQRGMKK